MTQRKLLNHSEKLKHLGIHLASWLLSTGLAIGCGASIYYLSQYEKQVHKITYKGLGAVKLELLFLLVKNKREQKNVSSLSEKGHHCPIKANINRRMYFPAQFSLFAG